MNMQINGFGINVDIDYQQPSYIISEDEISYAKDNLETDSWILELCKEGVSNENALILYDSALSEDLTIILISKDESLIHGFEVGNPDHDRLWNVHPELTEDYYYIDGTYFGKQDKSKIAYSSRMKDIILDTPLVDIYPMYNNKGVIIGVVIFTVD